MNCTDKVRDWINENGLLRRGDRVTAAVSGGRDSMAMLSILHELSGELGFTLSAAYFDHQIREDNEKEQRLVKMLCEQFGIPLITGSADVPALAKDSKTGLEEAARDARYAFLEKTGDLIALGHHSDDQVETVLHHIIRGTGLKGLAGMPVQRGRLIRPVLCCSRDELMSYCSDNSIETVEDPSNSDFKFLRNRIRHGLLPKLREHYNPSVDDALLRLAENARDGLEVLAEAISDISPELGGDGSVTFDAAEAGSLADYQLYLLVDSILRDRLGVFRDMTRKHFEAISALIRSGRSGKRTSLPNGVTVTIEHGSVRFTPPSVSAPAGPPESILLPGAGDFRLPGWNITVAVSALTGQKVEPATATASSVTLAAVTFPVVVRLRRDGDSLVPFGMKGRKKLSDIMIDAKVPLSRRGSVLVFEDAEGIIWVPGIVTAERTRVSDLSHEATVFELSP